MKEVTIEIVMSHTFSVTEDYAEFMEMSLDSAVLYEIENLKTYREDLMEALNSSSFKSIDIVEIATLCSSLTRKSSVST